MLCANPARRLPARFAQSIVCLYIIMQVSFALHVESAQQEPGNPQSLTFCGACVNGRSASSDCPFRGFSPVAPVLRASPQLSDHLAAFSCSCAELPLTQSCHCRAVCRSGDTGSQDSGARRRSSCRSLEQLASCTQHLSPVRDTPRPSTARLHFSGP